MNHLAVKSVFHVPIATIATAEMVIVPLLTEDLVNNCLSGEGHDLDHQHLKKCIMNI